jgi:hypothetical protein
MSKPINCGQPHYCVCSDTDDVCIFLANANNDIKKLGPDQLKPSKYMVTSNKTYADAPNKEIESKNFASIGERGRELKPLDMSKVDDKEILELCKALLPQGTNVIFDQLYQRFDTYRRVQSLAVKLGNRILPQEKIICKDCNGSGVRSSSGFGEGCPTCQGRGYV